METAHIKAFLKIVENGSISRAAESIGIAQPSLSQQLLRLEDEIGIRLFDRTARGVVLTEAGQVFRDRARMILHAAEQAVADTRQLRNEAQGQVVLAMPPSVAGLIGARLVEALEEQSPLARVRVVEAYNGTIRGWLEADKVDLGIMYDLHTLRHLTSTRLFSEEMLLCGPDRAFGSLHDPAQLPFGAVADHLLALPGPQHGLRQLLEREAARESCHLAIRYEVDSPRTVLDLVEHGRACTVLPACTVSDAILHRKISVAQLGDPGMRRTMSLVRNPSHILTHLSVRIENLLRNILTELLAEGWRARLEDDRQ